MKTIVSSLGTLIAVVGAASALPVITDLSNPYTQNFDSLASSGSTGTTLPDGWSFQETGSSANGSYGVGTGSSSTGNTFSFGSAASTDRALGSVRSGTLASVFGVQIRNSSGAVIAALDISYTGEQWRLGRQNRSDRLDFQYSLDASSLTTGIWTDLDGLDFLTPHPSAAVGSLNGNLAANQLLLASTLSGLSIVDGGTFWLRWVDAEAEGADDGLAVDQLSVRALAAASTSVPEGLPFSCSAAAFLALSMIGARMRRMQSV